jgi:DegV family protein with EDD domain
MVHIIADTLACLPAEFAREHHIPIIPQVIYFGNDSYLEGVTMSADDFMARLKTSPALPKTAAPLPELFCKAFEERVPSGEPILCIHPSAEVSGTVRSALTAVEQFPGADIRVIDTRLIASPLGSVIRLAVEWAEAGVSADEIVRRIEAISQRCHIYFLVATLEYLAKGGRIGAAQALLGSVLQIKPILAFQHGRVEPFEKERTHKRALARLKELVLSQVPRDRPAYLSVMHGGAPAEGAELAETLRASLSLPEVPLFHVPPAIITHAGPGVLAVAFFE